MFVPGPTVSFHDEIDTVKREAKLLKEQGVQVIIGLSHSGYRLDQRVAAEIPEIDVIVGGHSHTFLFNSKFKVVHGQESSTSSKIFFFLNGGFMNGFTTAMLTGSKTRTKYMDN